MSASNKTTLHKPLDTQRNVGSDMSIMCFARTGTPLKVSQTEQQLVRGLNAETITKIPFNPPPWSTNPEYDYLFKASEDFHPHLGLFNLSLSLYNHQIVPGEWEDFWFLIYGRIHPYSLTWQVELDADLGPGEPTQDFTIPLIMVRDQNIQPYAHP